MSGVAALLTFPETEEGLFVAELRCSRTPPTHTFFGITNGGFAPELGHGGLPTGAATLPDRIFSLPPHSLVPSVCTGLDIVRHEQHEIHRDTHGCITPYTPIRPMGS